MYVFSNYCVCFSHVYCLNFLYKLEYDHAGGAWELSSSPTASPKSFAVVEAAITWAHSVHEDSAAPSTIISSGCSASGARAKVIENQFVDLCLNIIILYISLIKVPLHI